METLFLSDLHLQPDRPETIQCFVRLLGQYQNKIDALYILGDLFEFWIGDDYVEPAYQPVKKALSSLTQIGTPVYLLLGNRDFLIGEQFCEDTGCSIIEDPTLLNLYGVPTLLMHGDTLCTDDHAYQTFRKMVRDPQWQYEFLKLSIDERLQQARNARKNSHRSMRDKDDYIMDVNSTEVMRAMNEHSTLRLIHGHTHRKGKYTLELDRGTALRIVLGDWGDVGSVLSINQSQEENLFDFSCL